MDNYTLPLHDLVVALCNDLDLCVRDREYLLRRFTAEGFKFLSIRLPFLFKAVLSGIELGKFDRTELTDFKFKGATLQFLQSLLNRIFCRNSGQVLSTIDAGAILSIRQICEYFYKLAVPFPKQVETNAISNFIQNEKDLEGISVCEKTAAFADQLRKDFETHYSFHTASASDILSNHRPRKTSGTFIGSDSLFYLARLSDESHTFPSRNRAFAGFYKSYATATSSKGYKLRPISEPDYSELLFVPKDSRGPRTICRESLKRLETQMAFFDFMCENLTRITQGAINFLDQGVNRALAESSSVDKRYATIDLKDASDRVSYNVVSRIFRNSPGLRWFIRGANRARHVMIHGTKKQLYKLAGMGSGLTFPTMSLLISLSICRLVVNRFGLPYEYVRKNVFIYGDDIIIPIEWYDSATEGLSRIGLKTNVNKCFRNSHFRESCGADYYNGVPVIPVRLKLSESKPCVRDGLLFVSGPSSVHQLYAHAIELEKAGLVNAAECILATLRKVVTMVPGQIQDGPYLVDFHKGTDHLSFFKDYLVNVVVPIKHRHLDRPLLSTNGRVYKRSPHIYMGDRLKGSRLDDIDGFVNRRNSGIESGVISRFEELTIPRQVRIVAKRISGSFLKKDAPSFSRDEYLVKHKVDLYTSFIRSFVTCFVNQ